MVSRSKKKRPRASLSSNEIKERRAPLSWERRDTILIIPVLLIAITLRLFNLDYMEFKADEAGNLFLASMLSSGKDIPLVGISSSIGTYNPPFFIYLMAIPLLFSRNPVIATGFVALLNCVAVGVLYAFSRRFFCRTTAVTAAAFMAINPWAVFYSRKIWQQDLLPLFVIGFFYCLFALICENRKKYLPGCFACLAAMTQLHLSSVYYLVLFGIVLVWFRPRITWGAYAAGIGVALFLYLPYIAFDVLHNGYNLRTHLQASHVPFQFRPDAFLAPFLLGSTVGFMRFIDLDALDLIQVSLIVIGVIYALIRSVERNYRLLVLWFFVPLAFLPISQINLQLHYFIFLYPVQFILLGTLAGASIPQLKTKHYALSYGAIALLVVLAANQLQSSVSFVTYIKGRQNVLWMDYGPPFRRRVEEIQAVINSGIVEPARVQEKLLEGRSPESAYKYDFPATDYIVRTIRQLPY
jgi:4-amino-4-deoxy-L-arabinose transferase-like glycosyltransferase